MHPLAKRDQIPPTPSSPTPPPPGIAGDLAKFVFDRSARPVPEVAILAALGIVAGICGKAFKIRQYGLNIRVVFIAENCVAENALKSGLESIVSALANGYPAVTQFIDFSEYSNGVALTKALALRPSFLNVVGDICRNLAGMTMSKNDSMVSWREAIEHPDKTTGSGYSLIAEALPDSLRKTLTASVLGSEFIHTLMFVECPRVRPPVNENTDHPFPDVLREQVINLCEVAIGNRDCQRPTSVNVDAEASLFLDTFDSYCNSVINGSGDDVTRRIWNGAHEKLLRVAALLAVADDCMLPIIKLNHAEWARAFVLHSIGVLNRHNGTAQKRGKRVVRS